MTNVSNSISVNGLSKKFSTNLKKSFLHGASDLFSNILGFQRSSLELRSSEFWALQNISFNVKKGEILGVIGHNGAGKTTLLNILTGIYSKTSGEYEINGTLGSLITLGAGFSPLLTGRENIWTNAALLGLSKKETFYFLDQIIDYADIGDFIESPVKNYSSGMKVRLGFAIAVLMSPQNLLVDEILGVGDANFKEKCSYSLREHKRCNRTLIVVSHNMDVMRSLCDNVIVLNKGKVEKNGNTEKTVALFEKEMTRKSQAQYADFDAVNIDNIAIKSNVVKNKVDISFHYQFLKTENLTNFVLDIRSHASKSLSPIFLTASWWANPQKKKTRSGKVQCEIQGIYIDFGDYDVYLGIQSSATTRTGKKWILIPQKIASFHFGNNCTNKELSSKFSWN